MNKSSHNRVNDILLGSLERPALKWLAAHSPKWMSPDLYTSIGVLGSFLILIGYILSRSNLAYLWLATLGFVINWLGDSLDGTLARYRHIERPVYGFYIDHVTDAFSQVLIFIGMGLSPLISLNVALLTLIAYLLLSVLVYVRTCVVSEFKISYGKLGPTEARVLAILLNISMFIFGKQTISLGQNVFGSLPISIYDLFVGAVGLLLLYFFVTTAVKEALQLSREC